ncbi:MAG TPA: glutathione peroxidase [Terracidiphilus sp.]|nr:glutathione peroxidase [Terracidiphilus sp.]
MSIRRFPIFVLVVLVLCSVANYAQPKSRKSNTPAADTAKEKQTVYDFSLVDQTGKVVQLSDYKGKVLLIVNLASQSVYSNQIESLNELEKKYASRGLVILGIPSSDFGDEELKDPAAMQKYYTDTAHAGFPVFAKATITGVHQIPLYQFLCDPKQSVPGGGLRWNYTKFIVGRDGHPLKRYEVDVNPSDIDFRVDIESALKGDKAHKSESGHRPRPQHSEDSSDDD